MGERSRETPRGEKEISTKNPIFSDNSKYSPCLPSPTTRRRRRPRPLAGRPRRLSSRRTLASPPLRRRRRCRLSVPPTRRRSLVDGNLNLDLLCHQDLQCGCSTDFVKPFLPG